MPGIQRSTTGRFLDSIFLPLRGLFGGTEGKWGLSSIRDERMRTVASYCRGKVLDIGCGPGNYFVKQYIGDDQAIGVDVYPYEGVELVVGNMARLPFEDGSFDTVTLIAVGGHIPKRSRTEEFKEFTRVLKVGGRLLMTEGEPITQYLRHKWLHFYMRLLGKKDVDTERGMQEGEEYCMPRDELIKYLSTPPLKFAMRKRFMWGLNNLYMAQKID
jgi:SAM-dependent methyltransferase